jgi:hypothetical protein
VISIRFMALAPRVGALAPPAVPCVCRVPFLCRGSRMGRRNVGIVRAGACAQHCHD